jgi:hypothetical protein
MELFDPVELSKTEDDIVISLLANPALVKYIRGLAQVAATDYAMTTVIPKEEQQIDLVANAVKGAYIQGILFLASELLIKGVPPEVTAAQ